jgi:uncharacterized protein YjbI with pentapeptide repeats
MDKQKGNRFEKLRQENVVFEKIKYDDCVFYDCHFKEVVWKECHFYQSTFNGDSVFKNCKFIDCKFTGEHTNLGPATYFNCDFDNINFKDIGFTGTKFKDSIFSGKAYNVVFYGDKAPKGWETCFDNVDISKLILDLVDFRTNFDFSRTIK